MNTLEQLRAGQLAGSRRLKLSCGLTAFPREIFDLAETLEILDLSGNALASLPADLPRLRKLRILFCSDNRFAELPEVLGQCTRLSMVGFRANRIRTVTDSALPSALRWLVLTDNQVGQLPPGIARCTQLQKLMLAGNCLQTLPCEMVACTRLELLRVAANRLTALPEWLFSLPRLAWLAYAGNPLGELHELAARTRAPIARIAWNTLQVGQPLGEGASGVIHQAQWRRGGASQDVAVKFFKGALTSDGLPQSEMDACLGAGAHPNLIPLLGKLGEHPAGADGLVMPLISPRFISLAAPPSLDSCTRDVYAADTRFALDTVLCLALGVVSAVRHLHAQGIVHGDLYAHNVLHDTHGEVLLGDFGAASFFAPEDIPRALALQRIEVRAFSCLLEELLERSSAPVGAADTWKGLADLHAACAQETTGGRPSFSEIEQILLALQT